MFRDISQRKTISNPSLKLYVYGSRESDQFWLPSANSHSRKPFCLTDVQKFSFANQQNESKATNSANQSIPNPLFNQPIYKIACGSMHSIVLTTNGRVFTFGCNDEGALGRKGIQCIPIQVAIPDLIDLIAAGDNHSLFANSLSGIIYFTGNYNYKRGEKMTNSLFQPIRIYAQQINITNKNKRIQKLSCGANHSCVLINGKIFCRGQPQASTIGRRISKRHTVQNSLTFNGVNLSDVVDIKCGDYHTVAKVQKNEKIAYYSWGTNDHGQLGIGTFKSQPYPTQIKKLRGKNFVKIEAGATFTLFLDADGEVYGCGNNEDSNLGLGKDYYYSSQNQEMDIQQQFNQLKNNQNFMTQQIHSQIQKKLSQHIEMPQLNYINFYQDNKKERQSIKQCSYIKTAVKIPLPQKIEHIATGDNFGFAWNKQSLYSWGLGYGYVLLNGEEDDESLPFKVKNKIIKNHSIYELDAGNQHVLYTSYPDAIKERFIIEPEACIRQNLILSRNGIKRKK